MHENTLVNGMLFDSEFILPNNDKYLRPSSIRTVTIENNIKYSIYSAYANECLMKIYFLKN